MAFGRGINGFWCRGGGNSVQKVQMVGDFLGFQQTVSLAGSEWAPNIIDDLLLEQSYSDFYAEDKESDLSLSDIAIGQVDRPGEAESSILFTQYFTSAGFLCCGEDEGGNTMEGVYDDTSLIGQPVYIKLGGTIGLAKADSLTTAIAAGLTVAPVSSGLTGRYSTDGSIRQTDWTNVTGTTKLIVGRRYYLDDANAGRLTITAPTADSSLVVPIGYANDEDTLTIEIQTPVLL